MTDVHLNHESILPPVDCPLVILVDGELVKAIRPTYVEEKGDSLTYVLSDGSTLEGRYAWTY